MIARKSKSERVRSSVQAVCQALERRMLLSLSPAGPEFYVNTFTTSSQFRPAIAADGDGDFVVAWESNQEGAGGAGIYAQRYSAAGVPQDGETHVNTLTPSTQENPAIAMDADGDFVIVWSSTNVPNGGIRAQCYNAAGVPQGTEFSVASSGGPGRPAVAMDVAGNFVVAYNAFATGTDIFFRRYDFLGNPQGAAVRANTYLTSTQIAPSIAMDADGDFVVVWESYLQDGSDYGVFAQRFNAASVPQGSEFRANSHTTSTQRAPAVAMDLSGDFVLTWHSYGQDGSGYGVHAQRYNASGVPQGTEFRANTSTTNSQSAPAVALDANGDFLISWSSSGIYAQQFAASGTQIGNEFRVNTFTTNNGQGNPAVAADHRGDYIITWESSDQEGPGGGIGVYAQRYEESTDTAGPIVAGVFLNTKRVLPYSTHDVTMQQIVVSFSEDMNAFPGGANSVTNPANWLLTRNGANITSDISSIIFLLNQNLFEATLNLSTAYTSGNFLLLARDTLQDATGNALDGDFDGAPGGSSALPFSVYDAGPRGIEFKANTYGIDDQGLPSVAMDAEGDFVIAWVSLFQDGSSGGVYAQRYNAAGVAQGGEFRVNTFTTNYQGAPSVTMDASGDFVVAWVSFQDGSGYGVYAQRFNALGVPQGAEFRVNAYTTNSQSFPDAAMDADGDFIVAWQSNGQDGSGYGVYAQRYNAAGVAQGEEFRVNTYTTSFQDFPSVAMDADGNFVVAWESSLDSSIYAQRYSAGGTAQGGEFRVNTYTTSSQRRPSLAMDADGNFVVAWDSRGQDAPGEPLNFGVFAQRYDAAGVAQNAEFRVNTYTTESQLLPAVAMDADGDFVIAWQSYGQDGSDSGIYSQRYNATGAEQGGEFRVNSYTTNYQQLPAVAVDADGNSVIAWESLTQDFLGGAGVYAQRYAAHHTPQHTPTVGLLEDNPDPVQSGNTLTLSARNVTDDGSVTSVSFYRESNGVAGLQVGFEGDTLVAIDLTPTGDVWSADISTAGLGGTYTYWSQATDDVNLIGTPASTTNTVTEAAPAVMSSDFLFNTLPQRITFTFNVNVGASLSLADFVVQNLSLGLTVTPDSLTYDSGTNTATLSFNTPLADGNYRATAIAAGITNSSGVPLPADVVFNFFFLSGDANHDGRVNLLDFNILAANFGQTPRSFSQGDFNYDTIVNLLDFNILAARFGTVLAPDSFGQQPIGESKRGDLLRELLDELT